MLLNVLWLVWVGKWYPASSKGIAHLLCLPLLKVYANDLGANLGYYSVSQRN